MPIKLIAFDLDGTLIDRRAQLAEENRRAVQAARAAGIEVILVTGRSWRGARPFYEALELDGPAICYLGALVVGGADGRVDYHRPLVPGAWERLKSAALTERLAVTACVAADLAVAEGQLPGRGLVAADTAYATMPASDFQGWPDWNPYTELAPDLGPVTAPPIMVAVYGDRAVRRMRTLFPDGLPECQFDLSERIAGETVLHVWHREVDKGVALARLCAARGITAAEVMAVGDAPMDLSMIRYAGIGVAVPDGHPDVIAGADWVAAPAEAVSRVLRGG